MKALDYALSLLVYRARTELELRQRMTRRGFSATEIENAITRLKEYKYIDDRRFTREWIEKRLRTKPMGKHRLKSELIRKGIAEEVASEEVNIMLDPESEIAIARLLARHKLQACSGEDIRRAWRKTAQFLTGRGFSFDIINRLYFELIDRDCNELT